MCRLILMLLALLLSAALPCACAAEEAGPAPQNRILIIDRGVGAEDSEGAQPDAARLAYEEIALSAGSDGAGQLGVVLFGGTEGCESHGPAALSAGPEALEETIGSHLDGADARGDLSDLPAALEIAAGMLEGMEGHANVLLLLADPGDAVDGDALSAMAERCAELAAKLRDAGAEFWIVSSAAQGEASEGFAALVDGLAEAGGGVPLDDGGMNNALTAGPEALGEATLRMLARVENRARDDSDDNIRHAAGEIPLDWSFEVPDGAVDGLTLNLLFAPGDAARLGRIALTDPEGVVRADLDGGIASGERGFIRADVSDPVPGQWRLSVEGEDGALPLDAVVRLRSAPSAESSASGVLLDFDAVTLIDNSMMIRSESSLGDFFWQVDADPENGGILVSWDGNGADDAVSGLWQEGVDAPVIPEIRSGDAIYMEELGAEVSYTLLLYAFTDEEGTLTEGEGPEMVALELEIVPDAEAVAGAVLDVAGSMLQIAPMVMDSEAVVKAAQMAKRAMGGASEAEAEAEIIEAAEPVSEAAETAAETEEPAPEAAAPAGFAGALAALRDSWMILAGALALIAAAVVVVLLAVRNGGEKVTGNLRVECPEIRLSMLLRFEGSKRVKAGAPLVRHPDVAKLKGQKAYAVLSHLYVDMAQADKTGHVEGSDAFFLSNDRLIAVTCVDERSGKRETCYVGRGNGGETALSVYDAGRTYKLAFDGNLSMEELLYNRR